MAVRRSPMLCALNSAKSMNLIIKRPVYQLLKRFCSQDSQAVIDRGVVLGVYEDCEQGENSFEFTPAAEKFNKRSKGRLREILRISGFKGKLGKSRTFYGVDKDYPCLVAVGLGKKISENQSLDYEMLEEREASSHVRQAAAAGARAMRDAGVKLCEMESFRNPQAAAEGAHLALFSFDELKDPSKRKLKLNLTLHEQGTNDDKGVSPNSSSWNKGLILSESQNLARRLMETPSNLLTPQLFADTVYERLSDSVDIIARDQSWAEEMKMKAFLSVGKGSTEPSVFLEMKYFGSVNKSDPPLVLVGKGVTFDSGGISIKPAQNMGLMKADMGGAATVVGAMEAITKLQLPINVVALIPLCENMPSGSALKPGDVIRAMNDKTIEIDNTDAEGRLILADALCYAHSFNPRALVNLATLTGAIDISLGQGACGVFTNSPTLWFQLSRAGFDTGERMWRMPLYKHYTKQIESDVADIRNTGKTRSAGACTAAVFLKEFVTTKHWAHIDIAGVMYHTDAIPYLGKGMSGRPTRALVELAARLTDNSL